MFEKRQAIDARARQIVEESGVLWAVARDQARAEDVRARQILDESDASWAQAADQARIEIAHRLALSPSSADQHPPSDGNRHGGAKALASRAGAVLVGLIAIGSTYMWWFGHVDYCGSSAGWWLALVMISPIVFIGLASLCAVIVPTVAETVAWGALLAIVVVAYALSLPVTLVGSAMAGSSCY